MNKRLTDLSAMNRIGNLLSGHEWTPDTLDAIAGIVRLTGRFIQEPVTSEEESCAPLCASRVPGGECTCGRVDRAIEREGF